jgi:TP901 family phage tail tape measure protein
MSSDGFTYLIKVDTNGNSVLPSLAGNANKADTSLRKIKGSSDRSFASLTRGAERSNQVLNKTKGLLVGLGLTLSTGALATGFVNVGAGFEKSMSHVQAVSQSTQSEMVMLKQSARDAGATTAYSARQSADAMGYLAQAGYKADQMTAALPATLNLAASGSLDLARSADIATNILSQYRMRASQTDRVVDQLAFTQARFNTNIEEASDAMNYFGPTAAAMKISLAESNATIGLMANNGLKGSLGTRALATSIVRLSKPTRQMRRVMNQLNLEFFDSQGNFLGMAGMVEQLEGKLGSLNDKQKQAALSTIFGSEAIQEINILMAEGADKIRYWTDELENADGTARKMADTKLDNLSGDFQILKSSAQEYSLSLYEEVQPSLRAATKEATLYVRSLDTKEVGLYLRKTVNSLYKGVVWIKQNSSLIWKLAKGYMVLKTGMLAYNAGARMATLITGTYNSVMVLSRAATDGATLSVRGLNAALMANPFGAVLGAITAVVTAVTLFRDRTNETRQGLADLDLQRSKYEMRNKDIEKLGFETVRDERKLKEGKFNERQLVSLYQGAKMRMEAIEDDLAEVSLDRTLLEKSQNVRNNKFKALQKATQNRRLRFSYFDADGNQVTESTSKYLEKNPLTGKITSLWTANDNYRKVAYSLNKMDSKIKSLESTEQKIAGYLSRNKGLLERMKPLLPEDELIKTGSKSVIPEAGKMSENIVSGGTSQRIINVKVDKFQDNINFNIKGELEELRNNLDDMREMVNEQLMRVLNSANQLANG